MLTAHPSQHSTVEPKEPELRDSNIARDICSHVMEYYRNRVTADNIDLSFSEDEEVDGDNHTVEEDVPDEEETNKKKESPLYVVLTKKVICLSIANGRCISPSLGSNHKQELCAQ